MIRSIVLALLFACGGAQSTAMSQPAGKPPDPQEEKVIERPGFVWKHGHWEWGNNQWNWIGGGWMPEQSGKTWRDGEWSQGADGVWHWHDGSWN